MALPPPGSTLSKRIVVPFPVEAPLSGALLSNVLHGVCLQGKDAVTCLPAMLSMLM